MRIRTIRILLVFLLAVGLMAAFAAPALADKPDRPAKGVGFNGDRFIYQPYQFPEIDESLRFFSLAVYDGAWRVAKGERTQADVLQFEGQWSICEPYSDGAYPGADALIRVFLWETSQTVDDAAATFTADGYAGTLNVTVEIPGTYLEVPAKTDGPPEDPYSGCYGVVDPIVDSPMTRELMLSMEWVSVVVPGKNKNKPPQVVGTTVTVAIGSFGSKALLGLPTGDSNDYYARSGPITGFVNHEFGS